MGGISSAESRWKSAGGVVVARHFIALESDRHQLQRLIERKKHSEFLFTFLPSVAADAKIPLYIARCLMLYTSVDGFDGNKTE